MFMVGIAHTTRPEAHMAKTSTPTAPNGGAAKPEKKLTKMEAVRQAIARLGWDAKPKQIQKHIRRRFGVEMTADHISTYKGYLAKKAGRAKSRPAPVAASAARQTAPAAAKPAPAQAGGVPLADILAVKELVGRLGAGPLHTLIDAFAK
jgi:hypothetical protein